MRLVEKTHADCLAKSIAASEKLLELEVARRKALNEAALLYIKQQNRLLPGVETIKHVFDKLKGACRGLGIARSRHPDFPLCNRV